MLFFSLTYLIVKNIVVGVVLQLRGYYRLVHRPKLYRYLICVAVYCIFPFLASVKDKYVCRSILRRYVVARTSTGKFTAGLIYTLDIDC